jgi:hypothetical protein
MGGLVTSTLLSILIVPPLYLRFAPGVRPHRPRAADAAPSGLTEGGL